MDNNTFEPLAAIIRNSKAIPVKARQAYIQALQTPPDKLAALLVVDTPVAQESPNRISFKEAARLGSCSIRALQNLCADGHLERVVLPGRKRAFGVKRDSFLALFGGGAE